MHKKLKIALLAILIIFAGIGLLFTGVFVAMQFGLFNVRGSAIERNSFFVDPAAPVEAAAVTYPCVDETKDSCAWNETPEWAVVSGGLQKDAQILERVAQETGVDARLIAAVVIPEQIRFFTAEREVFKRYFEPLKILGSLSKFSLGVSGIKQDTARAVEAYANDPSSVFYPGPEAKELLAYAPEISDRDAELFRRLTNEKDHYYSYLYTAIYLKEVMAQWEKAGFALDTETDTDALVTLFNIGFTNSVPKENPSAGGAGITVGGKTYVFGALGGEFYRSEELLSVFTR